MSFSGLEDTGFNTSGAGVVPDVDREDEFA
jgi:hypothetical protein